MSDHNDQIKQQFKKQAQNFSNQNSSLSSDRYIRWILASLPLNEHHSTLDVAAGTGLFSRGMAPFVSDVTALDLSPDMIQQGQKENEQHQQANIHYVEGPAENMPFAENTFDHVVCRFAFHHFSDPAKVLREMIRCGKPGSTITVVDMIPPRASDLGDTYNHYETLRDPSHAEALSRQEFIDMYETNGITVQASEAVQVEKNLQDWLALTKTNESARATITAALKNELAGGKETGLFPFHQDGTLMFHHTYFKIIGRKE